ncbi:GH92 family glycosyl hydrolase [Parapedobacter sp. ISTM3]|uniref:GH92 family glycosyl hydrolase n=1 Tax=Parapedobacter sp. ISTM3 TaxID=2800130 RepID=UPI001905B33E|nr:GH92 family glycosyl hydrolase [Parapedobacter sp. ISTM3]MBK1439985.1 GH92 family glycosyl hydrolase [Parapedobacter sp. ISTM3]
MKRSIIISSIALAMLIAVGQTAFAQSHIIWQIGQQDGSPEGMALAPHDYAQFIEKDFGYEDRFFLVGHSSPETDWPYVLPGPANGWGGTGRTSGIRSHELNVYFRLTAMPTDGVSRLVVDLLDVEQEAPPLFKVVVNGVSWVHQLKGGSGREEPTGPYLSEQAQQVVIDLPGGSIKPGYNEIMLTTLIGGWVVFDDVRLEGPSAATLAVPGDALIKRVTAAEYEVVEGDQRYQPLLIDVAHLKNTPTLAVELDGETVFSQRIEQGDYGLEVPMSRVTAETSSRYAIYLDDILAEEGEVVRAPQPLVTPADYVNTMMGVGHSRWMIAPGPWMPFSMVKISPDNQNSGWQAGYDPTFESIGTFSHIHEWTMAGLGTFPVTGTLETQIGDQSDPESGYRSRIDKSTEAASLGYYKVHLTDYNITAELTATTRASFQRYTYHDADTGRVMVDLTIPAEYRYQVEELDIKQVSPYRLEGYSKQLSRGVWSKDADQDYIVHFVMEFDQPVIRAGHWLNGIVGNTGDLQATVVDAAGIFVEFDTRKSPTVQVRTGISYVSTANAGANLETEITQPFNWDFAAVQGHHRDVWNDLLTRVTVTSNDYREKMRFYTNMYRSLASRNIFSDVDGRWRDADEHVRQFSNPDDVALGCDAFWNTFWNLNQFWNLVTPEWSSRWVRSQLAMYDAGGWLAKGPAGMEYIPVMVAEHEIPLIVGAYHMGIHDFDAEKAFEAVYKMQTTPAERVGGGLAGNRDLETYLAHQYVPYDEGRFSNTLEYSFDDWTVAQFAKSLDKHSEYREFMERGQWWRNAIDPVTGYARMKDAAGNWFPDFDPFKSGANKQYVEGNAWQLTYFVPQDIPALATLIGRDTFINRLKWGFEESYKWRFNGPNDQYWDYPVVQGNQQSMHFAFLFNWVGKPWLTQHWSRAIMDRYYGYGVSNAYLGDEDQGQMSAWFVMSALGLFQTDGGARHEPIYEIGSPIFERVDIDMGERYGRGKQFTITAINTSRKNRYIQRARLNGKPLENCWFYASELLKGGTLELEMGPEPNPHWGIAAIPPVNQ